MEDCEAAVVVYCSRSADSHAIEMEGTWDAEVEVELGPHIAFGRRSTGIFLVDTLKDLGRIAQNVESKWQASRQKGVLDWSLQNELWVARVSLTQQL